MEWQIALLIIASSLVVLLILGVPLAVSMGIIGGVFIIVSRGTSIGLEAVAIEEWKTLTNYNLLPILFFIALGELMLLAGLTEDMFEVASKWVSRFPGGLALITIVCGVMFATCSGSTTASTITIGKIAIPEMLKRGYNKRLAAGTVAAVGGLAHLIPPSILMVVYAVFVEVSVGPMLLAGVIPGLILATAYAVAAMTWALKRPGDAPREPGVPWKERLLVSRKLVGPGLIVFAVLGTIFLGITTVTEASVMGAAMAFILCVVRGQFTWNTFSGAMQRTVVATTFILLILVGAKLFSWVVQYSMIPNYIVGWVVALNAAPIIVIIALMVMYLVLGMFLDTMAQIFITMPVVLPLLSTLGYDPIWFGILILLCAEVGQISPPFGIIIYVLKGVMPDITLGDILGGYVRSYFLADLTVIALVVAFPMLALWLPGIAY